jgi:hypothetical protein
MLLLPSFHTSVAFLRLSELQARGLIASSQWINKSQTYEADTTFENKFFTNWLVSKSKEAGYKFKNEEHGTKLKEYRDMALHIRKESIEVPTWIFDLLQSIINHRREVHEK